MKKNKIIFFLDSLIYNTWEMMETTVHRKGTHVNRYLNYHSNHWICVKRYVKKTLNDGAKDKCSTREKFKIGTNVAINNSWSKRIYIIFIDNQLEKIKIIQIYRDNESIICNKKQEENVSQNYTIVSCFPKIQHK